VNLTVTKLIVRAPHSNSLSAAGHTSPPAGRDGSVGSSPTKAKQFAFCTLHSGKKKTTLAGGLLFGCGGAGTRTPVQKRTNKCIYVA